MRINPIAPTKQPTTPALEPAPAPGNAGLKRVSFGGLKKAADSKTKTVYPVYPDDERGTAASIAARIVERTEQLEALEGALKTDKAELKFMVCPHYFAINRDKLEVPSSIAIPYPADAASGRSAGEVLVTFQNRYSMLPDESALLPVLGSRVDEFFTQDFELKIKGDKLPQSGVQELLAELETIFNKYNCADALEVKEGIKPKSDFHLARHSKLTPEINLALEQVCPIIPQIKTKGRR